MTDYTGRVPPSDGWSSIGVLRQVETCCYGFLVPPNGAAIAPGAPDVWWTMVQRPFRASNLVAWGDEHAFIESIKIGVNEQVVGPLPFTAFDRRDILTRAQAALLLFRREGDAPVDLQFIAGVPCHSVLRLSPTLMFDTARPGTQISLRFRGKADGLLLIGEQLL